MILPVRGFRPQLGDNCFVAPNATLVGDLMTGDDCTFWFNAVVRGDVHSIRLGDRVNVQDGAVIHCTYQRAPTHVGSRVSIAHNAVVHGCTVEDDVLIGMGAIVMDHAHIGRGSVIAAGAVVTARTQVPPGSVFAGTPARRVRDVD
ncbi:MAG: gamma carbonic anhydrase family protein, partial [Catalinimonas sp.]